MWPPSSEDSLLAWSTVAIAFQRIRLRTFRSIAGSPGYGGSADAGIVFTYGVGPVSGGEAPTRPACSTIRSTRKRARSAPSARTTESSESIHSRVSSASMSAIAFPLPSSVAMCASSTSAARGPRLLEPRRTGGARLSPRPPAATLHVHAAVDGEHLPRDVARLVLGEELHHAGDLLGAAEARHRDLRPDLVEHLLRHRLDHLR